MYAVKKGAKKIKKTNMSDSKKKRIICDAVKKSNPIIFDTLSSLSLLLKKLKTFPLSVITKKGRKNIKTNKRKSDSIFPWGRAAPSIPACVMKRQLKKQN